MTRAQGLTIKGVDKWFGANHVVKDIHIEIEPGEFLVLLGPSGCGKTTVLRIIAGLETANSGQVLLGDTDISQMLPKYRDIAMVFQSYALYPHKTVAENIGFPLKVRGVSPPDRDRAVREAASQVHLEDLLGRYPRQLSGGQRQRVALARAIIRRPSIFLMDEPLSNLDAKLRGHMRVELKFMQQELGVTTVYVTHDQIEAMTLAHRIAIMEHGVLEQIGTPRDVYDRPANLFVAGFMGSPAMNLIQGTVRSGDVPSVEVNGHSLPVRAEGEIIDGQPVVYGIRPEHLDIADSGFPATVTVVEPTGSETIVCLRFGETDIVAVFHDWHDFKPGQTLHLRPRVDRTHLFDSATGKRA